MERNKKMKKFKDLEYKRVDFNEAVGIVRKLGNDIKAAKSGDELKKLYKEYQEQSGKYNTAITLASIRNTIDMNDKFYEDEMNYYYEELPKFEEEEKKVIKLLMESPYFNELREAFGDIFVKNKEIEQRLSSEETIEDSIEESKLTQEYSKVAATCSVEFMGEECNFYGLLKHMESTDRQERKAAFEAWAKLYEGISEKLDDIYTKLVEIRDRKAKKLGFDSYIDMAYAFMHRFDYDKKDVESFRKQVKEIIVPACVKLREKQRERLGVDKLRFYDESLIFPEGNAKPVGDMKYMVEEARKMYHELSEETGEFFDFMTCLIWRQDRESIREATVRTLFSIKRRLFFQTLTEQAQMWRCLPMRQDMPLQAIRRKESRSFWSLPIPQARWQRYIP